MVAKSGSTPSPGSSPKVMLLKGVFKNFSPINVRSGFGLQSTSRMPLPPTGANAWADANRPMPPPRKCGQYDFFAAIIDLAIGTVLVNPPHFAN